MGSFCTTSSGQNYTRRGSRRWWRVAEKTRHAKNSAYLFYLRDPLRAFFFPNCLDQKICIHDNKVVHPNQTCQPNRTISAATTTMNMARTQELPFSNAT